MKLPIEGRDATVIFKKNLKKHKEVLKQITASIDNGEPDSYTSRGSSSPSKRVMASQERQDKIARNNLKLANKIFDIMEGPGIITGILKKKEKETHPGTLNYKRRVREAARIHEQNVSLASRLENVKPYYNKYSLGYNNHPGAAAAKQHNIPALDLAGLLGKEGKKSPRMLKSVSARSPGIEKSSARRNNVLLEYSKIQNGRVLDVVVIKEPFQDRYAILGLDIDNGQRYELRLSSDEVFSILDGDILVTSLDNVEVWLALLNKVTLLAVDAFSKLAAPHAISPAMISAPAPVPAPISSKEMDPNPPTSSRPSTRPGGRSAKGQSRQNSQKANDNVPAVDTAPTAETLPVSGDPVVTESAVKIQALFRGSQVRSSFVQKAPEPERAVDSEKHVVMSPSTKTEPSKVETDVGKKIGARKPTGFVKATSSVKSNA